MAHYSVLHSSSRDRGGAGGGAHSQEWTDALAATLPLWAALIGVATAIGAAILTARAASINAHRTQIVDKFQSVREDLARFQAIQRYVDVQGYGGELPPEVDLQRIRAENIEKYFMNFAEETARARAALARVNVRTGPIWEVVTSTSAAITGEQIEALWSSLDSAEHDELKRLERWWLPNPLKVSSKAP